MKNSRVSISDIAKEVGTATSTVSRALNNHPSISIKTKELIQETARRMHYVPNSVAVNLKSGKKKSIGVIVPMISRSFFASAIEGIEDFAQERGYDVIICQSKDVKDREVNLVNSLKGKVDGVISSLALDTMAAEEYNSLQYINIPLVLFDRTSESITSSTVTVDDFQGAKNAVQYLIDQGYKRIFHFAGSQTTSVWKHRREGYLAALKDNGIECGKDWIYEAPTTQGDGYIFAQHLINNSIELPDAIFFAGDYAALGALTFFKEHGIRVPEDVAFVGFANEPFCQIISPTLTSVEQFSYKLGLMSCKILFDLMDGGEKQNIVIEPKLTIRESSQKK